MSTTPRRSLPRHLIALVALSVSLSASARAVSIIEHVDLFLGPTYTVINNSHLSSAPFAIFGFAVSNNTSAAASTTRWGWDADIISSTAWDAGYDVSVDFVGTLFSTADLGLFSTFFGSADHVNFYWHSRHYGDDILAGETSSEFHWSGGLESEYLAFGSSGQVQATGPVAGATVPDGGSHLALAACLALLGFTVRRRRAKSKGMWLVS